MYVWIWHQLPGNRYQRIAQTVLLTAVVCGLLLFFVFPWIEPKLWFTHVTVGD